MDERISRLLGQAENLDEWDKRVLGGVFEALSREQKALLEQLRGEVRDALSARQTAERAAPASVPGKTSWRITTGLVREEDRKRAESLGFFQVLPELPAIHREKMRFDCHVMEDELLFAGLAFLNCRYSELRAKLDRDYRAELVDQSGAHHRTAYRLTPVYSLVEKEKLVERTAIQYGVACPPLYAPMSRRAVSVWVKVPASTDYPEVDFRYQDNGLAGILLGEMVPVWNVEVGRCPHPRETPDKITPFGDACSLVYEFPAQANEFIYAEGAGLGLKRQGDKVYIAAEQPLENVSFNRITLHETQDRPSCGIFFDNLFDDTRIRKERIRTQADMADVIGRFQLTGLKFAELGTECGERPSVRIYDHEHAYHYPKSLRLRGGRTCCYVKFQNDGDLYFEDKVSFVTAYMNYFYPEFHWVGIV